MKTYSIIAILLILNLKLNGQEVIAVSGGSSLSPTNTPSDGQVISSTGDSLKWVNNGSAGAQTPWGQNIAGAFFNLNNVGGISSSNLLATNSISVGTNGVAPAGIVLNVGTGVSDGARFVGTISGSNAFILQGNATLNQNATVGATLTANSIVASNSSGGTNYAGTNIYVAGGIISSNIGFVVKSNAWLDGYTLLKGDIQLTSSNGTPYIISSGPTGTLVTNAIGGGSGANQTPITSDINYAKFSATNITTLSSSNIVIGTNTVLINSTNALEVYDTNGVLRVSVCKTNGNLLAPNLIAMSITADNATAGNIGEYVESLIASGSATALTTATAKKCYIYFTYCG
jgi:hypothetical protein